MTAILLAAGSATRFGSQKLLARLADGRMVVEAAAHNMRSTGEEVIAVCARKDQVARVLQDSGCRVVINSRAHEGMGTSIACGVQASADAAHWLIALGDMPFIQPGTMSAVRAALDKEMEIVIPTFGKHRGHPVAFSAAFGADLSALCGDMGARSVIAAHPGCVRLLETGDAGILADIDTPADLVEVDKIRARHDDVSARPGGS